MNKGVVIGVSAAAVVVLGGGSAFAAKAQLFSSPKQVLINAINSQNGSGAKAGVVTASVQVNNLSVQGMDQAPAAAQNLLNQINGSTLSEKLVFDEAQQKADLSIDVSPSSGTPYSAEAWFTKDSAIASLSQLQPLLNDYAQAMGADSSSIPLIPEYLVTSATNDQGITKFWNELSSSKTDPQHLAAQKDFAALIVQGIPNQYISRRGLSDIQIHFSQSDLKPILDSEIANLYQNQDRFVNDWNTLQLNNVLNHGGYGSTTITKQDVFGTTEQSAIQNVNDALDNGDMPFTLSPTTVDLNASVFGSSMTVSVKSGIKLDSVRTQGVSGDIQFSETATLTKSENINVPTPNTGNSKTFEDFFSQP